MTRHFMCLFNDFRESLVMNKDNSLVQASFLAIVRVLLASQSFGSLDVAVEETTVLLESVHEVSFLNL